MPVLDDRVSNGQSKIYDALKNNRYHSPFTAVLPRVRYWQWKCDNFYLCHPEFPEDGNVVVDRVTLVSNRIGPFVGWAMLKLICNAVCTSARFQKEAVPCPFCGKAQGDNLFHFWQCPIVLQAVEIVFPLINRWWLHTEPAHGMLLFLGVHSHQTKTQTQIIGIMQYALCQSYNVLSHQSFADFCSPRANLAPLLYEFAVSCTHKSKQGKQVRELLISAKVPPRYANHAL